MILLPCFSFDNLEFETIFSLDITLAIIPLGAAKDEEVMLAKNLQLEKKITLGIFYETDDVTRAAKHPVW